MIFIHGGEMKKSIFIILSLLSSVAFADTVATEQLLYEGFSQHEELNLSTEKTRTEWRYVEVPSTCYRSEVRRRCIQRPPICRNICNSHGNCRRSCRPGGLVCRNVVVRIPYSCLRTVRRAFQVHDYFVETNVQFEFYNNEVEEAVRERLTMTVRGETPELKVQGSNNYFLILDNKTQSFNMRNGVKNINLIYKISLVPTTRAIEVLGSGIKNVKYRNGMLNFSLGAGFNFNQFKQRIRIYQNRRLGRDTLLLDRDLSQQEMNVATTANASLISIDLKNLGVNIPSKIRVILDTSFIIDEARILNANQVKTSTSANWIFR